MALWMVRAGKHGEHERKIIETSRVYATWEGLDRDLRTVADRHTLAEVLEDVYPNQPKGAYSNYAAQLWTFARDMKVGDWVIVPYKTKPAINVAEITGPYVFDGAASDPYYHFHDVKWIQKDIPRTVFDQDLLYSFGAFMTICRIRADDAERRLKVMAAAGWKAAGARAQPPTGASEAEMPLEVDLEEAARDQIAKLVIARFKGHGLARLVDAVLRAQGYQTYLSPEGADKGVDIVAAPGPLGFGQPRICVQVKSGDGPVDSPTLNQLIGSMQNVKAEHGLLVSWGGFKSSVERETATKFFGVRLWDQKSIVDEVLSNYDRLDADIKTELPLKRIWTIASESSTE